ncbi:hypothetical protein [Streptomyces bobili]|uniref:hypothetical protein n=1 Tax=Streptomyces bobili TaxID=67280 RepID=UPI003822E59C
MLDHALAPHDTDSLIVLLQAALTSPDCQRLADHRLLMLTRVLRTPPRTGPPAAEDLPGLVDAVVRAAPGRGVVTDRHPSDLRPGVRHHLAGEYLLVHPGQLAHPLLVLRSLQLTALAVDEPLCTATRLGIGGVLELALCLTDRALSALGPRGPNPPPPTPRSSRSPATSPRPRSTPPPPPRPTRATWSPPVGTPSARPVRSRG